MSKNLLTAYNTGLKKYLADGGENALKNAYLVGREALKQRVSTLDLVLAHHRLLARQLGHVEMDARRRSDFIKRAGQFLAECLSSFEMAQRGFLDSIAELNSLNARLESEVESRTQAMRESEERYRTLVEISPDAITMTDLNGRITFCNRHAAELHGFLSPEQLLGFESVDFVLSTDVPRLRAMAKRVMREGLVGMSEYTLVRPDGQNIPVEVRVSLVRDADGQPVGFLGVNRSIVERRQAEQKLASQARQQTLVAELGQRALSGNDLDGLLRETTSLITHSLGAEFCELLELRPDGEALLLRHGVGWRDRRPGRKQIPLTPGSLAAYVLSTNSPLIMENLAQESRFSPPPYLQEHGVAAGMCVTIQGEDAAFGTLGAYTRQARNFTPDEANFLQSSANILAMAINNRRLLETEAAARQEAEQDNEARLKGLAIVSHELRTPLTSIKGFASTLLARDVSWSTENQREFIETIDADADKLSSLIEQLLDLTKMEAGAFKYTLSRQATPDLITAARVHLHALTLRHKLKVDVPPSLPDVWADPQRVGQILENLVENATKYAPAGSTITISARACPDQVELTVADEGPGILPTERDMVFQPFYRTNDHATLIAHGAGLGLTICRKLVEAQGGLIWVHERTEPGAVISFTLPLATEAQIASGE